MKELFKLYRHSDMNLNGSILYRKAYRAIILSNDKVLLIKSKKFGEYKFPGGGKEHGEKAIDVLSRETLEETGYRLKKRIIPFGKTMEYAKDFEGIFDIFQQLSHYYFCNVYPEPLETNLSNYEIEYGYFPSWVTLEEAIANNESLESNDLIPWKERDTAVFKLLLEMRQHNESKRIY